MDSLNSIHRCPKLRTFAWGFRFIPSGYPLLPTSDSFLCLCLTYVGSSFLPRMPQVPGYYAPLLLHMPSSCYRISQQWLIEMSRSPCDSLPRACAASTARPQGPRLLLTSCPTPWAAAFSLFGKRVMLPPGVTTVTQAGRKGEG